MEFVTKINDTAAEIGCTATTFANPTGLYDTRQQTTARDMLTITNYALSLDGFEGIATATAFTPTTANPANHPDASAWNWTQANSMTLEDAPLLRGCQGYQDRQPEQDRTEHHHRGNAGREYISGNSAERTL